MSAGRSTDPVTLLLGALADEIADRLVQRLGLSVGTATGRDPYDLAAALRHGLSPVTSPDPEPIRPDEGLWTASRVAAHYDVAVRFVYHHADELGCFRLGGGARPRLRFDPDVVAERWPRVGGALPEPGPTRRRSTTRSEPLRRRGRRPSFELLDFDRET
jgi:hypothetical protein